MSRCLCCNKEMNNPTEYEKNVSWHGKCIKRFFGTNTIPELEISDKELERLADLTVNKGLTVPGVQKKLSLHLDREDRGGRLTIVDYLTGYILKPQSQDYWFLPEAEFLSMKMAEKIGIKTVPNALIKVDNTFSYITKRIDRLDNKLYAMEDFCQLSERLTEDKYRGSYEGCGKIIKKYSKNIGIDITDFYYRLLFCFVTGNSDMHLKNFSLIEDNPRSRKFLLSPAYDMLPVNIIMPEDTEQMALTLCGKKSNLKRRDFMELSDNLGIQEKVVLNLIKRIVDYKELFIDEVEKSYLSDEMKIQFEDLMRERVEVLRELG